MVPSAPQGPLGPCGAGSEKAPSPLPCRRPASAGTMDSEAFQSTRDLLDLNFQCELG